MTQSTVLINLLYDQRPRHGVHDMRRGKAVLHQLDQGTAIFPGVEKKLPVTFAEILKPRFIVAGHHCSHCRDSWKHLPPCNLKNDLIKDSGFLSYRRGRRRVYHASRTSLFFLRHKNSLLAVFSHGKARSVSERAFCPVTHVLSSFFSLVRFSSACKRNTISRLQLLCIPGKRASHVRLRVESGHRQRIFPLLQEFRLFRHYDKVVSPVLLPACFIMLIAA